jgi:3-methyladenine DNA glycosylase AlkD
MNAENLLSRLENLGSEQTRKTYRRHGASEPLYGVKYSDLYKVEKEVKRTFKNDPDGLHTLAVALWETGNYDARILAALLANGTRLDAALLEKWLADCGSCHALIDAFIHCAAASPDASAKREEWRSSADEWIGRAGWRLVTEYAADAVAPDTYFTDRLAEIEARIHVAPNRTREAMNSALIAIGLRPALTESTLAVAVRIGKIHIDHGDTSCKTPDAATYIARTLAYRSGSGGQ